MNKPKDKELLEKLDMHRKSVKETREMAARTLIGRELNKSFTTGVNTDVGYVLEMPKAKIRQTKSMFPERFVVDIGTLHQMYFCINDIIYSQTLKKVKNIPEKYNTHIIFDKFSNTFQVHCFERGVGETDACDSSAYAVGVAMMKHFALSEVKIIMKGGKYIVKDGLLIVKK